MMDIGYRLYQAEHVLNRTDQQQVDTANAKIAAAVARPWNTITALIGTLRPMRRSSV